MTYIITDETTQIKIVASNGLEWNIDKDDCLVLKVPAKTKDNTTTKDKLYIGNDGQWPLQLFYDEVTVDGNTPSDIDDFEDMVNAILQNNGSGGSADLEDTITRVQAVALLDNGGADIELGKTYFINDIGATIPELQFIKLTPASGKDSGDTIKIFSPNAEAYITALATYVPCTYDVATNTAQFDYLLWAGHISQSSGAGSPLGTPTIDSENYNISGETPTLGYVSDGRYSIVFTSGKLVSADATKHFSFIYDGEAQGFYTIEGVSGTDAEIKCFRSGAYADDRLANAYIEIRLVYTP